MKIKSKASLSIMKKGLVKSIILMLILGFVTFTIMYLLLAGYVNKNISTNEINAVSKSATQIDDCFSQISSYSFNLSNTYTLPSHLKSDDYYSLNTEVIKNNILSHLVSSKFLSGVEITNKAGEMYTTGSPYDTSKYNNLVGKYINCNIFANKNNFSESLMFEYIAENAKFNKVDIVVKSSYLNSLILNENTYIINSSGNIILGFNEESYNKNISDLYNSNIVFNPKKLKYKRGNFDITATNINKSNLYVISIISTKEYTSSFIKVLFISLFLSLGVSLIAISAMFNLWHRTYKRIVEIVDTLKYHFPNEDVNIDELSYINTSIKKTLELNKESQKKQKSAVFDLRMAQARALYSQISPHFIANTLENIKSQSILALGIHNNISNSIFLLTKIISEYIQQNDMFSTINDEIGITNTYVELSNMKFKLPFNTIYNIDDSVKNCMIIKLTIQPFIENTVIHSFTANRNNQIITISISRIPNTKKIKIVISDNGCGIDEENLKAILDSLKSTEPPKDHIGIKNVDIRYKLLYGNDYGITSIISSTSGTSVTLTIPLLSKENTKLKM